MQTRRVFLAGWLFLLAFGGSPCEATLNGVDVFDSTDLKWVMVGPFDAPPGGGVCTAFPPEWNTDPHAAFRSGNTVVRWTHVPAEHLNEFGAINFHETFGLHRNAVAYALTHVFSDRPRFVELRFGCNDTLVIWLNGQRLDDVHVRPDPDVPDVKIARVRLTRGNNTLLAKVIQDAKNWKVLLDVSGYNEDAAQGLHDGFTDYAAYHPDRGPPDYIIEPSKPMRWLVAGPFPVESRRMDGPGALDAILTGDRWSTGIQNVSWKSVRGDYVEESMIDLTRVIGDLPYADAYAFATIRVDRELPVELVAGSEDGLCIWLNGDRVLDVNRKYSLEPTAYRVRTVLLPGDNYILCRIRHELGPWRFRMEVWDLSRNPPCIFGAE